MDFESVEAAIRDIRDGKMVIVIDEEDRENEGDLTMAAEKVTPEAINFMATYGKGLICLPMTGDRLQELQIPEMVQRNESAYRTAFCVSIEARKNVSTGISAADRATTILTAIRPETRPEDLIRPGHIFPLKARDGGVLERAGQTEAAVDLSRMAGLSPAGVICEIMNADGTMARLDDLKKFSAEHDMRIVTVVDLIKYRLKTERFIKRVDVLPFETSFGSFSLYLYRSSLDGTHHLALTKGDLSGHEPVLLRVHTESVLADVFSSTSLGETSALWGSLEKIEQEGRGVVVFLRGKEQEHQLLNEFEALRGKRAPAERATFKDYGVGAQIIADLGLHSVRLLTNHPKHLSGLEGFNINIVEQLPVDSPKHRVGRTANTAEPV